MTERLPVSAASIARAADVLRAGRLVAFPTETVYGLGADARSDTAVSALYAAKERPLFNPLIAHLPAREAATREACLGAELERLTDRFWPGPLTVVAPAAKSCSVGLLARAGLDSVALRVPSDPTARALLDAAGFPVVAPSANRSGRVSPTTADHVLEDLGGRIDLILDGGACPIGVESTIVSNLEGSIELLRPGGIARAAIEDVLGHALGDPAAIDETAPAAPGLLRSHYAPRAAVRLDAREVRPGEAVLDFGGRLGTGGCAVAYLDLSPAADLREAAARLFAGLRQLDRGEAATIAVAPITQSGLGEAINDRLARAAAPRG